MRLSRLIRACSHSCTRGMLEVECVTQRAESSKSLSRTRLASLAPNDLANGKYPSPAQLKFLLHSLTNITSLFTGSLSKYDRAATKDVDSSIIHSPTRTEQTLPSISPKARFPIALRLDSSPPPPPLA